MLLLNFVPALCHVCVLQGILRLVVLQVWLHGLQPACLPFRWLVAINRR